jgi:hypothetical protein
MTATGFTNIIFAGASVEYNYATPLQKWHIFPNVIFFWQESPTTRYQAKKHRKGTAYIPEGVAPFLGTEVNLIADIDFRKDSKFFICTALFIPGAHFESIEGEPLNAEQRAYVKDKRTHVREPMLGSNFAYVLNVGIKVTF